MRFDDSPGSDEKISRALPLMTGALTILDKMEAPGEIGSTLDLAISKLTELLGDNEPLPVGAQSLPEQLERELSRSRPHKPDSPCPW